LLVEGEPSSEQPATVTESKRAAVAVRFVSFT
jgi:hypothetical protein